MKDILPEIVKWLDESKHILLAGLSGGFIRVRAMALRKEPLNFYKILLELISAAICSYYLGEFILSFIPSSYQWSDNFIHFITGYGGMGLVDFVYKKFILKK